VDDCIKDCVSIHTDDHSSDLGCPRDAGDLRFNKLSNSTNDELRTPQSEPRVSPLSGGDNISPKQARKNQRQLTIAMCHIIIWSFFGFGIMTFMTVVLNLAHLEDEENQLWRAFRVAMIFVLYINSSVNFLIFYFFVADFRDLFHKRLASVDKFCSDYCNDETDVDTIEDYSILS
jgi:hypothetical protein